MYSEFEALNKRRPGEMASLEYRGDLLAIPMHQEGSPDHRSVAFRFLVLLLAVSPWTAAITVPGVLP